MTPKVAIAIEYDEFEEEFDGGDELEEGVDAMSGGPADDSDYEDTDSPDSTEEG